MIVLRAAHEHELGELSVLCYRSKAHWGYDEAFMAACREELTLRKRDLADTDVVVAEMEKAVVGVAQVSLDGTTAWLEKLFVAPEAMGCGVGRRLYNWSVVTSQSRGARALVIESDPDAAAFYERQGAVRDGEAPSGSVPGRVLPRLVHRVK